MRIARFPYQLTIRSGKAVTHRLAFETRKERSFIASVLLKRQPTVVLGFLRRPVSVESSWVTRIKLTEGTRTVAVMRCWHPVQAQLIGIWWETSDVRKERMAAEQQPSKLWLPYLWDGWKPGSKPRMIKPKSKPELPF